MRLDRSRRGERSRYHSKGKQLKAILTRCRIDANAERVYYDDAEGFIVHAEGGPAGHVRYVFKSQEEAYQAATRTFTLRRFKRFG